MKIDDFIFVEKNVISKQFCDSLKKNHFVIDETWKTHTYENFDHLTKKIGVNQEGCLTKYLVLDPCFEDLQIYIVNALKRYELNLSLMSLSSDIIKISAPRLNRYLPGVSMKNHFDGIRSLFDGEEKGIPILSIVCQIFDADEGGEFVMFDDKIIDFKARDILIFPSTFMYTHKVNPVVLGEKWSIVCWAY